MVSLKLVSPFFSQDLNILQTDPQLVLYTCYVGIDLYLLTLYRRRARLR